MVKDVKVEYGALRIRFDLKDDGALEVVEEKGDGTVPRWPLRGRLRP